MGRSAQTAGGPMIEALRWADAFAERHERLAMAFATLALVSALAFLLDRQAPAAHLTVPPQAYPGAPLLLDIGAQDQRGRQCTSELASVTIAPAAGGSSLVRVRAAGDVDLSALVPLPPNLQPGPAAVVAQITYRCNRMHKLWPVQTTASALVTISP